MAKHLGSDADIFPQVVLLRVISTFLVIWGLGGAGGEGGGS